MRKAVGKRRMAEGLVSVCHPLPSLQIKCVTVTAAALPAKRPAGVRAWLLITDKIGSEGCRAQVSPLPTG